MNTEVIGLYSFPKSGNTWVRNIIANAVGRDDIHTAIPDIYNGSIWEHPVKVGNRNVVFYKSHSKNEVTKAYGRQFKNTQVIYIIRHPLDVFLSQLNYISDNVMGEAGVVLPCKSVDDIIRRGDIDLYLSAFCTFGTLQPRFDDAGSWVENTQYWTARQRSEPERILILRYEDISENGIDAVKDIASRINIPANNIARGFEAAQNNTKLNGKFFWKQKVGNYRDLIPSELIDRFRNLFDKPLVALGYTED
jgi:hypothetical protein